MPDGGTAAIAATLRPLLAVFSSRACRAAVTIGPSRTAVSFRTRRTAVAFRTRRTAITIGPSRTAITLRTRRARRRAITCRAGGAGNAVLMGKRIVDRAAFTLGPAAIALLVADIGIA